MAVGFARSWREMKVGRRQFAVGRVRKSEVGVGNSRLRAENCERAKIVVCARWRRGKPPAVAVRDEGLRPVMTGAKVRSDHPNNKAFNVKLS